MLYLAFHGIIPSLPCRDLGKSFQAGWIWAYAFLIRGFPGGSAVKNMLANAGDPGSIPGLARSPGEGNGSLLQCSFLGKLMDRGAWWPTVHRVLKESDMS